MNHDDRSEDLIAASRLTGADLAFYRLVQAVSSKQTGSASVTDPAARERIGTLHEQFRRSYAALFEKHLGRDRAVAALAALETATMQRYLAARSAMAPALQRGLQQLQQRMGNIEV
jgi:hypothetical protein